MSSNVIHNHFNGTNTINILVILGLYDDGVNTLRTFNKETNKHYNHGFIWNIWKSIEHNLEDKYIFNYHYTDPHKNPNYNQICKDIHNGKYDLCLGLFKRSIEREGLINFCAPLIIDANTILYKESNHSIFRVINVIKQVWHYFIFLLLLGLLFGFVLFVFDKERSIFMTKHNSTYHFAIRSIMTGIASVFGEMGYLAERCSLSIKSLIICTLIMMIAFIIIMYIQGEITNILVTQNIADVNKSNIKSKPILGEKGNAILLQLEKQGAKIDNVDKDYDEIIEQYLDDSNKYLGVGISYADAHPYLNKYPVKAALGFGFYSSSFIISHRLNMLREDINYYISHLRDNGELQKICHSYFGNIEDVPMCTLR